ncbi:SH3 domain-containing protein [Chlamydiota bacterium]
MKKIAIVLLFSLINVFLFAIKMDIELPETSEEVITSDNNKNERKIGTTITEDSLISEENTRRPDATILSHKKDLNNFPWVGEVTGIRVNLRSGNNINFEILCQKNKGDLVIVLDEHAGWYKLQPTEDMFLWIHKDFVELGIVTAYSVNVRSGPGTQYSINCQAEKADKLDIVGEVDQWYKIKAPNNASGWIHSDLINFKMTNNEYTSRSKKLVQDALETKERERLFNDAEQYEKSEFYKPLDEIAFDQILFKYQQIINNYPLSTEANKAREQIQLVKNKYTHSLQFMQSEESSVNEPEKDQEESYEDIFKEEGEYIVVEGVLEDFGVVIKRPGTYKLVDGRKKICILHVQEVDLNRYIHKQVKIKGTFIDSDFDIPAIEVKEVFLNQ